MDIIMSMGAGYFLCYLTAFGLDYIISLRLDSTLNSVLTFICTAIRLPRSLFEALFGTPQVWDIFILICAICFLAKILKSIIDGIR